MIVSQRLVAVNAASSLVARLLNVTVLLWMYQYLLTRISTEEFAVYPVMMALMAVAPLFFSMFTGGVSRHIVEAYARGQSRRVTEITSSILPLLVAAGTTFLLIGLVAAAFVDDILKIAPGMEDDARLMLSLLVANYAVQMVTLPFGTGFHVRQRFVELNMLEVLRDLLRIVLLVTLLVGVGPSVLWVVVARVIADQVYVAVRLIRSHQLVPEARFRWELVHWATARDLVSFGLWTTVGRLAILLVTHAGTLILNDFGSALDVTVYYLGATAFQQISSVISIASFPLLPAMTAMHALADRARLARTTLRGARYGLWVSLAAACPLAIYSREFVQLYLGESFASAAIVLSLFMVVLFFRQPRAVLSMVAMATARVRAYHLGAFVSSLIGVMLMFYLVAGQGLGALGAVLALVVVTAASELAYFWPLQLRITGVGVRDFVTAVLWRGSLPAVVGSAIWASLGKLFPPETWFSLIAFGAIGAVAYAVALVAFCLDENERKTVKHMVSRILR